MENAHIYIEFWNNLIAKSMCCRMHCIDLYYASVLEVENRVVLSIASVGRNISLKSPKVSPRSPKRLHNGSQSAPD